MKKLFLFILVFLSPQIVLAEVIKSEAIYKHLGDVSPREACKRAEQNAKEKAIKDALGLKISLDERRKCRETDGVLQCEENQTSVLSLNGEITEYKIIQKDDGVDELSKPKVYYCRIQIDAKVKSIIENDLNLEFDVRLNRVNFRNGEDLSINFILSEPIFLTIYQYHPYEKINKVSKLFPNTKEKNNQVSIKNFNLPSDNLAYKVEFPTKLKREQIDEHLIFIATKKKIKFLDSYFSLEDLTKRLMEVGKENIVRKEQKTYTIYE